MVVIRSSIKSLKSPKILNKKGRWSEWHGKTVRGKENSKKGGRKGGREGNFCSLLAKHINCCSARLGVLLSGSTVHVTAFTWLAEPDHSIERITCRKWPMTESDLVYSLWPVYGYMYRINLNLYWRINFLKLSHKRLTVVSQNALHLVV